MASCCDIKVDVSEIMPLIEYMRRQTIRINRRWWVAYLERKRRLTIRMFTIDGKRIGRQYRICHVQLGYSQLPGWGHG